MPSKKNVKLGDIKHFYSNSLVTGVPEIVNANNTPVRIFRAVVFVFCMAGFIYQSLDFMDLYWKYPTTIDIQISRKREFMLPALTVCDPSGIRLSKFCQNYPCRQPNNIRRFCRCFEEGRYCEKRKPIPGFKIPEKLTDIVDLMFVSPKQNLNMMPTAESFVKSCMVKRPPSTEIENCGDILLTPSCRNAHIQPSVCFIINSLYKKPKQKPQNITVSTEIEMQLYSPPSDYDPGIVKMYKQLNIHFPYSLTNPFIEGYYLKSETRYKIFVKQTVKNLLKPPYETDCFDYLEAWERNGGIGPMTEDECTKICELEYHLKYAGCKPFSVWYPHDAPMCLQGTNACTWMDKNSSCKINMYELLLIMNKLAEVSEKCASTCKPACRQITYEVTKEEAPLEIPKSSGVVKVTGLTYVVISFQGMEETLYTYKPKYEVVETFSYIGGYMGIWMGVSLLAVYDFLETTMMLFKYIFQNKTRRGIPKNL